MRIALWLVPSITLISLLIVGGFSFFVLLVGLNGVSGAKGGQALIAHLVVLVAVTIFSSWASRWMVHTLSSKTDWSVWVSAPLSIIAATLLAIGIIIVASFIVLAIAST